MKVPTYVVSHEIENIGLTEDQKESLIRNLVNDVQNSPIYLRKAFEMKKNNEAVRIYIDSKCNACMEVTEAPESLFQQ